MKPPFRSVFFGLSVAIFAAACGGGDSAAPGTNSKRGKGGTSSGGKAGAAGSSAAGSAGNSATKGGAAGSNDDPNVTPSTEICGNQVDDDDNGAVDENCGCDEKTTQPCFVGNPDLAGKGQCALGRQSCAKSGGSGTATDATGAWTVCVGSGRPEEEKCGDGIDNDCDGTVDEGCDCSKSVECSTTCGKGTVECVNGKSSECSAPKPTSEVCDGKDNDCDGVVDEDLERSCKTACGDGKQKCSNGQWTACDAKTPEKEACDGVDNDCNGKVDESCDCKKGDSQSCKTACGDGTQTCGADNKWGPCTGSDVPEEEKCDGKDNDCDGKIDENIVAPCQTGCGLGVQICFQGVLGQCSARTPTDEICKNGKDDDCDGMVDEDCACKLACKGNCCPGNATKCCPNGTCPDDQGKCACLTVECNEGCCKGGTACCSDGSCPDGDGLCAGDDCPGLTCDLECCPVGPAVVKCCDNGRCPTRKGTCEDGSTGTGMGMGSGGTTGTGGSSSSGGGTTGSGGANTGKGGTTGTGGSQNGGGGTTGTGGASSGKGGTTGTGGSQNGGGTTGSGGSNPTCDTMECTGANNIKECCQNPGQCCTNGKGCPNADGSCVDVCNTFKCKEVCCESGSKCCKDGACPGVDGKCPEEKCATVECEGTCCPGGTACCGNGKCPGADGKCTSNCDTTICGDKCCPTNEPCGKTGKCTDSTGVEACENGPVKAMLVLDRSMSMRWTPTSTKVSIADKPNTRWAIAVNAITQMMGATPPYVNYGLVLYPRYSPYNPGTSTANDSGCQTLPDALVRGYTTQPMGNACSAPDVDVMPGEGSNESVKNRVTVDRTYLCDYTSTGIALKQSGTAKPDYVILVTDGEYNCGGDPLTEVQALVKEKAKVFVVGFDGSNTIGAAVRKKFNEAACVGGVPNDKSACKDGKYVGPANAFYDTSGEDLVPVLKSIGSNLTCVPTCHSECEVGSPIKSDCNDKVKEFCKEGSLFTNCCALKWDEQCVSEFEKFSKQNCSECHPPCKNGGKLTESCDSGVKAVCETIGNEYCCTQKWDLPCIKGYSEKNGNACNGVDPGPATP